MSGIWDLGFYPLQEMADPICDFITVLEGFNSLPSPSGFLDIIFLSSMVVAVSVRIVKK